MSYLIDTNILLRSAEPTHPMYGDATNAIQILMNREKTLYIATQNLIEFWNVYTRPRERNGLGYEADDAEKEINQITSFFCLLPESPNIYTQWQKLVINYRVKGVNVHDARLVAFMLVHDLTHILTFNVDDFQRYREITVINPQNMI